MRVRPLLLCIQSDHVVNSQHRHGRFRRRPYRLRLHQGRLQDAVFGGVADGARVEVEGGAAEGAGLEVVELGRVLGGVVEGAEAGDQVGRIAARIQGQCFGDDQQGFAKFSHG